MRNGWTGGQYSLFRVVFAVYLTMYFLGVLDRSEAATMFASTLVRTFVRGGGVVLCLFFGIGLWDRAAALGLMGLGLCLYGLDVFVDFLLVAHVLTPAAPYGSWAARGRVDPGGGWRMPPPLFAAVRIALILCYATLMARLCFLARFDFALGNLSIVMYHLFAFDPGWIPPRAGGMERLFYDGHCGLCQRSVRLILAEDATGTAFRFAPLQGETFVALLTASERVALPMSLVVRTEKGILLTRSSAVLHILRRLGGLWRLLAGVLVLLPTPLRDGLYDGVARIRHRIFARPADACPLMPKALRARFDP